MWFQTKTLETKLKLTKSFCFLEGSVRRDGENWSESACSTCECKVREATNLNILLETLN